MNNQTLPTLEHINQAYDNLQRANMNVTMATLHVWERKRKLEKECAEVINSGVLNDKVKYPNEAARSAGLQVLTMESADLLHEAEMNQLHHKADLREAEIEIERIRVVMELAALEMKAAEDARMQDLQRRLYPTAPTTGSVTPSTKEDFDFGSVTLLSPMTNPPTVTFGGSSALPPDTMPLDGNKSSA